MTEFLFEYGVSNVLVALAIGVIAWALQTIAKRPALAHLLWVVVLVKLLTPPFVDLPVASPNVVGSVDLGALSATIPASESISTMTQPLSWQAIVVGLWLAGSLVILAWSCTRIIRFSRLLRLSSQPADEALCRLATGIADELGLKASPSIYATEANISPMVWWMGGRTRLYLPSTLVADMHTNELRWVLAHELGHVRRGDHIVRWLEWLVCVALWWNPVAWWARRNLRISEEVCCDALVLAVLRPDKKRYASSLVTALEVLAKPIVRPPAMASEMNGGGFMERRLKMIISKKPLALTPRWLKNSVLVAAAVALPLGFGIAQETGDYERVSRWLEAGVNAAELTQEQAEIMLRALRATESGQQNAIWVPMTEAAYRKAMLVELRARLEQAFEAGELTEEEMVLKLMELSAGGKITLPQTGEVIDLVPVKPQFTRPDQ